MTHKVALFPNLDYRLHRDACPDGGGVDLLGEDEQHRAEERDPEAERAFISDVHTVNIEEGGLADIFREFAWMRSHGYCR